MLEGDGRKWKIYICSFFLTGDKVGVAAIGAATCIDSAVMGCEMMQLCGLDSCNGCSKVEG
jgi:hypothetical protein